MTDPEEVEKRTRAPGVRYPGASLVTVLELLKVLESAGGESSVGRIAAKLDMAEGAATFKRVLISARGFELAEWRDTDQSVLAMTDVGEKALAGDQAVLRRALILPPTFRAIARKFRGRTLPTDGLAESFRVIGVAPAGAQLAADNFEASATAAGALTVEAGRKILTHDLPFDAVEAALGATETTTGRATTATATATATAKATEGTANKAVQVPPKGQLVGRMPPPKASVPKQLPETTAPLGVDVRLDVSGWSVDKVVELIRRLRDEGLG